MTVYYKATQPDGTDFRTGTVDYDGALTSGEPVMHPDPFWDDAAGYLSISVEPADTLIGGSWPCRLFEVEPVGEVRTAPCHPYKRAVTGLRMVREVEAWRALGPRGESVAQFIARTAAWTAAWTATRGAAWTAARTAAWTAAWTATRGAAWTAARDAAWTAARTAARDAVWDAAWGAAGDAVWDAAWDAAGALLVRDRISPEQFRTLTEPWKILTGEEL